MMDVLKSKERNGQENGHCTREALPEDLSTWLEKRTLVGLVIKVTGEVPENELVRVASVDSGAAFQPRLLLTLLTYCYGVGIPGSQEIERFMYEDLMFRFVCGNEFPDWHVLRRFRRMNREHLHRCLEALLQEVIQLRTGVRRDLRGRDAISNMTATNGFRHAAMEADFISEEVADRIERAIMLDSIDLED